MTNCDGRVRDWSACTALSPGCPHLLMGSLRAPVLRYRPVRETPIYEQLCSEAITADVASRAAVPPREGPPGRHRRLPETTGRVVGWWGGHHQDEVLIVLGARIQPREQPISHLPPPRGLPRWEDYGQPLLAQRMPDHRSRMPPPAPNPIKNLRITNQGQLRSVGLPPDAGRVWGSPRVGELASKRAGGQWAQFEVIRRRGAGSGDRPSLAGGWWWLLPSIEGRGDGCVG